jgi:hypothetical protein
MRCAILTVCFFLAQSALGQESRSIIGNFHILRNSEPDDNGAEFVAVLTETSTQLAFRCTNDKISVTVSWRTQNWNEGDLVDVKFHADKEKDVIFEGRALDRNVVEIHDPAPLLDALAIAKMATFRFVSSASTYNEAFSLRQPDKVIEALRQACPK